MSTPPITTWVPKVSAEPTPAEIHRLFTLAFQKLGNHATAFALQQAKINAIKSGTSTTIVESSGGGGSTPSAAPGIPVNNQSGQTSYATASSDNGALIVLSDASAIAVTLTAQTPPWGCFIANQGARTATLTPGVSGALTPTISYAGTPGAASMPLLGGYGCVVGFDGSNWWALTMPIVPVGNAGTAHQWIASYDAATGVFTLSQPAFADVSGVAATDQIGTGVPSAGEYVDGGTGAWTALPNPTLPATIAPVAGQFLTGYDAATGNFSQATPAGLSVTITTAALTSGGTQGSMTFVNGLLVSQVQAT